MSGATVEAALDQTVINAETVDLSSKTGIGRWSCVGPYYAMFPVSFAFETVAQYCPRGGSVLDPFAGRASSIYAAVTQGRTGYGIEVHPVGWVYGKAKLAPAAKSWVLSRLGQLKSLMQDVSDDDIDELPEFYHHCYCRNVLKFLVAARANLRWQDTEEWNASRVDTSLMAILLIHLHGKLGTALSNQMRQGKAMDPKYSVKWWSERKMSPPKIDPLEFVRQRIEYRYKKGVPEMQAGHVELGDSTTVLKRLAGQRRAQGRRRFDLVLTSPPYYGIANYFYDQWLRLWLLGGSPQPEFTGKKWERKFESKKDYRELLLKTFQGCKENVHRNSVIYVRTDARKFALETTIEILKEVFPDNYMRTPIVQQYKRATQTALYGDKSEKLGEMDIILEGRHTKILRTMKRIR